MGCPDGVGAGLLVARLVHHSSDHAIVATFGTVYRGVVPYYLLAGDVFRLQWVMETSMLKTLAAKHRSSVSKMAAKHKAKIDTPNGPRVCFEARIERKNRTPLVAGSLGFPSNGNGRRNSPIVSLSGSITRRRNSSRDSWIRLTAAILAGVRVLA